MAKFQTAELHKTPGGNPGFFQPLQQTTQCVREHMAQLVGSRKPQIETAAALRILAILAREVSLRKSIPVTSMEVDYWQENFLAWFGRVKKHFAEDCREDFLANANADFEAIRECAKSFSAEPWQQKTDRFQWRVDFVNREAFDKACQSATEKYPVKLGIALDKYLKACIKRLSDDDNPESPLVVQVQETKPGDRPGSIAPRLVSFDDGVHSIIITDFGGFGNASMTANQLQTTVKKHLRANSKETLKDLDFDSESSLFCVRSESLASLSKVTEMIYRFVSDAQQANATTTRSKPTSKKKAPTKKMSAKRVANNTAVRKKKSKSPTKRKKS